MRYADLHDLVVDLRLNALTLAIADQLVQCRRCEREFQQAEWAADTAGMVLWARSCVFAWRRHQQLQREKSEVT